MPRRRIGDTAPVNFLALSPLRSFARRTGIVRVVTFPARARVALRRWEYLRGRPSFTTVQVNGQSARMRVSDATEYARVCSFRDDRAIIGALMAQVRPGDHYWDIGASIGLYSCLMARAVGEGGLIAAFEPEKRSFRRLEENIATNALSNVKPFNLALGSSRGELELSVSEAASSGTHTLFPVGAAGGSSEKVQVLTGDELRKEQGLPVPNALKVDVEGAEEEVIKGLEGTLGEPRCRAVLVEVHFSILEQRGQKDAPARIAAKLRGHGFTNQRWIDHSHLLACK